MVLLTSLPLHVRPILLGLAGALGLSTACFAQSTAAPTSAGARPEQRPTGDTIRLTDEEQAAILASNTAEGAAAARGERGDSPSGRAIHGEAGVMIGSNGTRGAYGTAAVPLGDNAEAVVSFETSRFGRSRR